MVEATQLISIELKTKISEILAKRVDLLERVSSGEIALSDVLSSASKESVAETKLLPVMDSLPGRRKIDNRRTLQSLSIAEEYRRACRARV